MKNNRNIKYAGLACVLLSIAGCKTTSIVEKTENKTVPENYADNGLDTLNTGKVKWRSYFTDENLENLIDIALKNNRN